VLYSSGVISQPSRSLIVLVDDAATGASFDGRPMDAQC
jgi:hypothetical protein